MKIKISWVFVLVLFGGMVSDFSFENFVWSMGPEARAERSPDESEEIRKLGDAAGFDFQRGVFTGQYAPHRVTALVEGVNSPYPGVITTALRLLAEAIKQLDVLWSIIDQQIRPEIEKIQRTPEDSARAEIIEFVRLANRVSWYIHLKELADTQQSIEFLWDSLENSIDSYYYPFEAIDRLVEMGTNEAKAVLQEKLAESQQRSMSEKLLERLRISIKKIDLLQRLTALPSVLQVQELGQVFMQYEETKSSSDHDFKIWLIRAIGEINTLESRKLLKHIWRKARYDTTMRYEAQEALVQSGAITDTERTITFLVD